MEIYEPYNEFSSKGLYDFVNLPRKFDRSKIIITSTPLRKTNFLNEIFKKGGQLKSVFDTCWHDEMLSDNVRYKENHWK